MKYVKAFFDTIYLQAACILGLNVVGGTYYMLWYVYMPEWSKVKFKECTFIGSLKFKKV